MHRLELAAQAAKRAERQLARTKGAAAAEATPRKDEASVRDEDADDANTELVAARMARLSHAFQADDSDDGGDGGDGLHSSPSMRGRFFSMLSDRGGPSAGSPPGNGFPPKAYLLKRSPAAVSAPAAWPVAVLQRALCVGKSLPHALAFERGAHCRRLRLLPCAKHPVAEISRHVKEACVATAMV